MFSVHRHQQDALIGALFSGVFFNGRKRTNFIRSKCSEKWNHHTRQSTRKRRKKPEFRPFYSFPGPRRQYKRTFRRFWNVLYVVQPQTELCMTCMRRTDTKIWSRKIEQATLARDFTCYTCEIKSWLRSLNDKRIWKCTIETTGHCKHRFQTEPTDEFRRIKHFSFARELWHLLGDSIMRRIICRPTSTDN